MIVAFAFDLIWSITIAILAGVGQFHAMLSFAPRWAAITVAVFTAIVVAFELADYARMKRERRALE